MSTDRPQVRYRVKAKLEAPPRKFVNGQTVRFTRNNTTWQVVQANYDHDRGWSYEARSLRTGVFFWFAEHKLMSMWDS